MVAMLELLRKAVLGIYCPRCFKEEEDLQTVKGFTPLCPTWAASVDDGLVAASLWIPPEV